MSNASAILVALVVVVALFVLVLTIRQAPVQSCSVTAASTVPLPKGVWLVVGTGVSAASLLYYLPPPVRAAVRIAESSNRVGGRVLSSYQPVTPVSTAVQAFEFGAWVIDPFRHVKAAAWLQDMQVSRVVQKYDASQSFVFVQGKRQSWPSFPELTDSELALPYSSLVPEKALALFSRTNFLQSDVPLASVASVVNVAVPTVTVTPAGLGWTDTCFRGMGMTVVQYGQTLQRIAYDGSKITLSYASGAVDDAEGVVLTLRPSDIGAVAGIPAEVVALAKASQTTVSSAVMYLTWSTQQVWWQSLGFQTAVAATDLEIGRVSTIDQTSLRCQMTGSAASVTWTSIIVREGLEAAKLKASQQLAEAFGLDSVPLPDTLSFRAWPSGYSFWNAGVDVTNVRSRLIRPLGSSVPVWWCSSDLADQQNWVEGALDASLSTASSISQFLNVV